MSDTEQPLRCSIASSLIVPSPPLKPRLSERALHPHPHVPLLRPAYLRPPFLSKRKLFWVLPIHLSLVPSSPGPCALPEPSASPIPFPILFHSQSHIPTNVPCPVPLVYMLIRYSPLPIRFPSSPLHARSDLSSTPHRARAQSPFSPFPVFHPGTLSFRPPMANQLSIPLLTHPFLPPPSPAGAASHPRVGPAYSSKLDPPLESR